MKKLLTRLLILVVLVCSALTLAGDNNTGRCADGCCTDCSARRALCQRGCYDKECSMLCLSAYSECVEGCGTTCPRW